jgi:hypothetical protein
MARHSSMTAIEVLALDRGERIEELEAEVERLVCEVWAMTHEEFLEKKWPVDMMTYTLEEISRCNLAAARETDLEDENKQLKEYEETHKMLRWYLGAKNANAEEAAMASKAVLREFEAAERNRFLY